MKISNFNLDRTEGSSPFDRIFFATVDVETGFLLWKKKSRRAIRREYGSFWHFVDTGEFGPGHQIEDLARSFKAKTGEEA